MRGALVNRSSDLTGLTFPVLPVNWNNEVYDTDALWDVGSPGRFTIPSGVSAVRLMAGIEFPASSTAGSCFISLNRNGAGTDPQAVHHYRSGTVGYTNNIGLVETPILQVTPGDYFEVRANITGMGSPTTISNTTRTFFAIEIVE